MLVSRHVKKWLKIVLLVIWIGSMGMYVFHLIQSRESKKSNEAALELAQQQTIESVEEKTDPSLEQQETEEEKTEEEKTEEAWAEQPGELVEVRYWVETAVEDDPYMEELEKISLEQLRSVNEDVLGWIQIPETKLEYPLMLGEDNNEYLKTSWDGKANVAGSIFLEQVNDKNFRHFNTVIYGHRMKDGSMFGSLKYYSDENYWKKHPYVYIVDDGGVHRYEIFAAYEASLERSTYQVGFADEESRQKFLEDCMGYSDIDTGVIPEADDRIITLSTCTGTGYESRWVVQAVRRGEIITRMEPKPSV